MHPPAIRVLNPSVARNDKTVSPAKGSMDELNADQAQAYCSSEDVSFIEAVSQ